MNRPGEERVKVPVLEIQYLRKKYFELEKKKLEIGTCIIIKYDILNYFQMMSSGGMQQSPDGLSLDPGGYQQPLYLQQEHSMQPISVK